MTSLPMEKEGEGGSGNCIGMMGVTQTTIDEVGGEVVGNGYGFYYQFPYFYGTIE